MNFWLLVVLQVLRLGIFGPLLCVCRFGFIVKGLGTRVCWKMQNICTLDWDEEENARD